MFLHVRFTFCSVFFCGQYSDSEHLLEFIVQYCLAQLIRVCYFSFNVMLSIFFSSLLKHSFPIQSGFFHATLTEMKITGYLPNFTSEI